MASNYDPRLIKVKYLKDLSTQEIIVYNTNQITSATIVNGTPRLIIGSNIYYYDYDGQITFNGKLYDTWLRDDHIDLLYTNVITDENDNYINPLVSVDNAGTQLATLFRDDGDWVWLPTPTTYSGSSSTLVNSGRNADGVVIGDVIREDVSKVELTWNFLTLEQYSDIAKLFENRSGGSFYVSVRYFDSVDNAWRDKVMYPNDREFKSALLTLVDGKPVGYENVSLHLIDTCKV